MRIENWSIGRHPKSPPYKAPESCQCLSGNVYDSSKFEQGKSITTGVIVDVDYVNQLVRTASDSIYELGAAHPNYEKEFPNARARFFKEI